MPKLLDDSAKETDRCYTPLEHQRRAEMKIRDVKMGFFRVVKEPIVEERCMKCNKDVVPGNFTRLNGQPYHWECRF